MGLNGEGAIALLVQQAVGKRLTYAGLIGGLVMAANFAQSTI